MQKIKLEYAEKILAGQYVFGKRFLSIHDGILAVTYDEDQYPYEKSFYGTRLKDGNLQVDDQGYVSFSRVKPVVDESTRFTLT